MADTRNTGRIKKYGVCLNDKCEKYKQIQEILHGDFECPECKKKLSPCAPPKKKSNKKFPLLITGVIAAIAIITGCIFAFSGGSNDGNPIPVTDSIPAIDSVEIVPEINVDTVVMTDTIVRNDTVVTSDTLVITVPEPSQKQTSRSKDLGYASWNGALKNGLPNDEQGKMTFKESHLIDSRDPQKRVAEPGDYILGEFVDGKLVQGVWYDKTNTVKGSIIIGR